MYFYFCGSYTALCYELLCILSLLWVHHPPEPWQVGNVEYYPAAAPINAKNMFLFRKPSLFLPYVTFYHHFHSGEFIKLSLQP